jgi:hypothetical protein
MNLEFSEQPAILDIYRCAYSAPCRARGCRMRGILIALKCDAGGRPIRQIELCLDHTRVVMAREATRRLEICDHAAVEERVTGKA